jgi:hypothetical protein
MLAFPTKHDDDQCQLGINNIRQSKIALQGTAGTIGRPVAV